MLIFLNAFLLLFNSLIANALVFVTNDYPLQKHYGSCGMASFLLCIAHFWELIVEERESTLILALPAIPFAIYGQLTLCSKHDSDCKDICTCFPQIRHWTRIMFVVFILSSLGFTALIGYDRDFRQTLILMVSAILSIIDARNIIMLPFSTYAWMKEAEGSTERLVIFSDEIVICIFGRLLVLYISWAWFAYQYYAQQYVSSEFGGSVIEDSTVDLTDEESRAMTPRHISQIPTSNFPTFSGLSSTSFDQTIELAINVSFEQNEGSEYTPHTISTSIVPTSKISTTDTITFSFGSLVELPRENLNMTPSYSRNPNWTPKPSNSKFFNIQTTGNSMIDLSESSLFEREPGHLRVRCRTCTSIAPMIRHNTISEIDCATMKIDFETFQRKKTKLLQQMEAVFEDTMKMAKIIEDAEKLFEASRFVLHSLSDDQYNKLWPELSDFRIQIMTWKAIYSQNVQRLSEEITSLMH